MEETKQWYTSKAVWGGVVAMVLGVLGTVGVELAAEQDSIVELLVQIGVVIGGALALFGRIYAKKRIGCWILVLLLIFAAGCGGVRMSAPYAQAVEQSAIVVSELDKRCQAGDDLACKEGLHVAAETLDLIVAALHGKGADHE